MAGHKKKGYSLVLLPIVDCAFILLFVFMTAYAINADYVPPPIPLPVDDYFEGGEVYPKKPQKLIDKLIQAFNEKDSMTKGKLGMVIVTGHADTQPTNPYDRIIYKKKKKKGYLSSSDELFKDQGNNFDYSYLRARLVRDYLDSLNNDIRWGFISNAKFIIKAAGSEVLKDRENGLSEENRRIEISFER